MSKKFVLWGASGHAKVLASIIYGQKDEIIALFDNNRVPLIIPDVPLYYRQDGFFKWLSSIKSAEEYFGLVAIGGHRGKDRVVLQNLFLENGLDVPILFHPSASVCSTAKIGVGTQILAQTVVAADAQIGDACIINNKASVDHECILGNGVHVAPGATLCGCVNVADYAMIGAGAVVLPRIHIGEDSIVSAGAVVTKNVAPNLTVTGNPAREINNNGA